MGLQVNKTADHRNRKSGEFYFGTFGEIYLGVDIYQNAVARSGIIRSFCWAIIDSSGLDPRVGLAVRDGNGQIEAINLSASERDQLDVSPSDIDAARQTCPWPGGVN